MSFKRFLATAAFAVIVAAVSGHCGCGCPRRSQAVRRVVYGRGVRQHIQGGLHLPGQAGKKPAAALC